jgi:hypothetical protein
MRLCAALLAIACLALTGCRNVSQSVIIGTWITEKPVTPGLLMGLPPGSSSITFRGDGTFVANRLPGLFDDQLDSGSGTWRIGQVDGEQRILLTFTQKTGDVTRLPYGGELFIAQPPFKVDLHYYRGDPDESQVIKLIRR